MEDLWKVRKRKRMTIGELSGRTGISSKVLRRYEMGEIPIPLTDIERLARSLYVEPWEIKIQSDPPPMPPPDWPRTSSTLDISRSAFLSHFTACPSRVVLHDCRCRLRRVWIRQLRTE